MSIENFIIVTAHPEFSQAAVAEIKQLDKSVANSEELTPGVVLCNTSDVAETMRRVVNARPVFARHIAPAQTVIELQNNEHDLGAIALAIIQLPNIRLLERGTRFAVQSRLVQTDKSLGERPYTSGQLNRSIAEALAEETLAVEAINKPQIVVSILCTMHKCYLGISSVEENLSSWPGGNRHFAQTSEQISRAEFKLLEALELFDVVLPSQGHALDLGAAPGGWTRLLLDAGMSVVAVDPANLDRRITKRQGLEHYRGYAEHYIEDAVQKHLHFDVIVNDMRMDARDAARLLARSAVCLNSDGFMVSVLKLPHTTPEINPLATLREAMKIIHTRYGIVRTRQLFHNRQEVTVIAAQPILARK